MFSKNTILIVFIAVFVINKSYNTLFGAKLNGIGEFFDTEIDFIMGKFNGTEFSSKRTLIQRVNFLQTLAKQFFGVVVSPLNMENWETRNESVILMDIMKRSFSRLVIGDVALFNVFKLSEDEVIQFHNIHDTVNRTLQDIDRILNKLP